MRLFQEILILLRRIITRRYLEIVQMYLSSQVFSDDLTHRLNLFIDLSSKEEKIIMKKVMLIFSMSMLLSVVTWAQDRTPRVNERQYAQHGRVLQGKRGGEITHREASLLRNEQRHIRRYEHHAKSDGVVTRAERKRLDKQQDWASRHIHRAKNNDIARN